jgi:hypothetical protein
VISLSMYVFDQCNGSGVVYALHLDVIYEIETNEIPNPQKADDIE